MSLRGSAPTEAILEESEINEIPTLPVIAMTTIHYDTVCEEEEVFLVPIVVDDSKRFLLDFYFGVTTPDVPAIECGMRIPSLLSPHPAVRALAF